MSRSLIALAGALALAVSAAGGQPPAAPRPRTASHEELLRFFDDWRAFQKPKRVDGAPDYSPAAMAAQRQGLVTFRRRLAAIDPTGWPIPQQVDYHVVRAEMNGLDFDHRVLRPWSRNPAFYVSVFTEESDQPAREGPFAEGGVELWSYSFPLSAERAAELDAGMRAIPTLLKQAQANLVGDGRDLWAFGTRAIRQQSADLAQLAARLNGTPVELATDVARAREATEAFAAWLDGQAPSKNGPSGVGIDNYDWYLKNVQLVPCTWREELAIAERELARAHALLAMEEKRNAGLPPQEPTATAEEYARRSEAGLRAYLAFLRDHDILTVTDDMEASLRAHLGAWSPPPREFFAEVDARDPELMRTHGYHWFDKARLAHHPHESPIRRGALLYNIFNTRTEGHATGWEELMMQAGMFDDRPRTRELVYVLLAERAARALGELRMQANQLSLEEAAALASAWTPRGWLSLEGRLVREEQHLYLQQPGYGTSYLIGKIEIEKLLAERRRRLGAGFSLRRFSDELNAAGLVPASLLRWELTGELPGEVREMLQPPPAPASKAGGAAPR